MGRWFHLLYCIALLLPTSGVVFGAPVGASCRDLFASSSPTDFVELRLDRVHQFSPKWILEPRVQRSRVGKRTRVRLDLLHFMQSGIANVHSQSRHTVLSNAELLRSGKLRAEDLPPIQIWEDQSGRIWTLDHRRVGAMILSGVVKEVPAIWVKESAIRDATHKFGTVDWGHTLSLTGAPEGHPIYIRRPGPMSVPLAPFVSKGVSLLSRGELPFSNVPRVRRSVPKKKEVRFEPIGEIESLPIHSIHWSEFAVEKQTSPIGIDAMALAREIKTGVVTITTLPPLRVWKDRSGKVWTIDNHQLAACHMSGINEPISIQWVRPSDPTTAEKNVRSFTNGTSTLVIDRESAIAHVLMLP